MVLAVQQTAAIALLTSPLLQREAATTMTNITATTTAATTTTTTTITTTIAKAHLVTLFRHARHVRMLLWTIASARFRIFWNDNGHKEGREVDYDQWTCRKLPSRDVCLAVTCVVTGAVMNSGDPSEALY